MAKNLVLVIKPNMSQAEINRLQNQLNKAFGKVAKTFDSSLSKASRGFLKSMSGGLKMIAGGSLFGLGMNIVNSLSAIYDKGEAHLNKMIAMADDIDTASKAFTGGDIKEMRKLQTGFATVGIDNEALQRMLMVVKDEIGKEKMKPGSSMLQTGPDGHSNIASEAFLQIISGLQDMVKADNGDTSRASAEFERIFGFRMNLKAMELLQQSSLQEMFDKTKTISDQGVANVKRGGELEEYSATRQQNRETAEIEGATFNRGSVDAIDRVERAKAKNANYALGHLDEAAVVKIKELDVELAKFKVTVATVKGAEATGDFLSKIFEWLFPQKLDDDEMKKYSAEKPLAFMGKTAPTEARKAKEMEEQKYREMALEKIKENGIDISRMGKGGEMYIRSIMNVLKSQAEIEKVKSVG